MLNADQTQSLAKGLTNTGQIMGTLDYMAPEQTSNTHTVDIRADIYSLGCTLYALLAGRPPFAGSAYSNAYQKMVAHNRESPRPLHEIRSNVPAEVVAVLNKMLAKNPDDRYTSPIEVATALQSFCANNTLLSTLVEAEARQAEYKAQSDAATQALNSSALEGTATGAGDDGGYSFSPADELIELLRSTALAETLVAQRPVSTPAIKLDIAAAPTVKQVRQHRAEASNRWRAQIIAAAGCALLGIIITAVVFRIMTNYGTIELALYHKDAQVTVDGDTVRLRPTGDDDHYTIRVAPGKRTLRIEKDGYTTFARELEIAKGEEKIVAITLRRDEPITPPTVPEATSNDSSDSTPQGSSRRSVTATLVAPPPLEEWLVGREILTVKQDGTAMYTRIQDAIDAAEFGHVVQILDRGPYRETLNLDGIGDGGLISTAHPVIEPANYKETELNGEPLLIAHRAARECNQMRISGIDFYFHEERLTRGLEVKGGCVVEGCAFRFTTPSRREPHCAIDAIEALLLQWESPFVVRNCIVDGGTLHTYSYANTSTSDAQFTRNLFIGDGGIRGKPLALSGGFGDVICSECVFVAKGQHSITLVGRSIEGTSNFGFANNTILATRQPAVSAYGVPIAGTSFENNVIVGPAFFGKGNVAEPAFFENWSVRHNWFTDITQPRDQAFVQQDLSNRTGPLNFLSTDENHRDFLRLPATSPAATGGAGGDQPTYLGALPPGPAPPDGDWFTRLQERWKAVQAK